MENEKDPLLNYEDALKAENAYLKFKLAFEHGMDTKEFVPLPPYLENSWLKSIYEFEQHFKNAKRVKVYDYIGRPSFRKADELKPEEFALERKRLEVILEHNNIQLDCLVEYDDALIYRFITEELFEHEMDDMRIPGMTLHYTYEEFHPNHDYDLRTETKDFVNAVFIREWNDAYDVLKLDRPVTFSGRDHEHEEVSAVFKVFQEAHESVTMERFDILDVSINEPESEARVTTLMLAFGQMRGGERVRYDGPGELIFRRTEDYWFLREFDMPGFRKQDQ